MTNELVSGKVTLNLKYVSALKQNGSPDPSHCSACETQLSNLIDIPVTTEYSINTKTNIISAESSFYLPDKNKEIKVKLNALGLSDSYSFGVFRPTDFPEAYAVLFSINREFKDPTSSFEFLKHTLCYFP